MSTEPSNITVAVRIRPLNEREQVLKDIDFFVVVVVTLGFFTDYSDV